MAKPRVALVAYDIGFRFAVPRVAAELVTRLHDDVDFVVVSTGLARELEPLVEWRRVRADQRSLARRSATFFIAAPWVLRRVEADLTHSIMALVPNRVDVASVHASYTAFHRAVAGGSRWRRTISTAVERWCFERRSGVLAAPSERLARDLRELFPSLPVVVTPNGVRLDRFSPSLVRRHETRAEQAARDGDLVALFVGNVGHTRGRTKGLEPTIAAFARARESVPALRWLWVLGFPRGSAGEELAEQLGVGDRVRFLGFRDDPERFYAGADIFVLPTAYEEFCLAAVEAAAAGLPLVSTRTGAIADLLEGGEAGMAVQPTAADVTRGLERLASDAELRARMGEAARRRASRYTWDAAAEAVLRLYREVLAARA